MRVGLGDGLSVCGRAAQRGLAVRGSVGARREQRRSDDARRVVGARWLLKASVASSQEKWHGAQAM